MRSSTSCTLLFVDKRYVACCHFIKYARHRYPEHVPRLFFDHHMQSALLLDAHLRCCRGAFPVLCCCCCCMYSCHLHLLLPVSPFMSLLLHPMILLLCYVVLCCAVLCCAVLCCAVLCCTMLYCAVLICMVTCNSPEANFTRRLQLTAVVAH